MTSKFRILLMTAPIEAAQRNKALSRLRRSGIKLALVGSFPSQGPHPALTPRQVQVLRGMALGFRGKEIAHYLGISIKTVETHRLLMTNRLGIRHIPGFVRYALRTGVLPASWLFE